MASSRSWGLGSISWRPGNIQACVSAPQYHHEQWTPRKLVAVRAVRVTRSVVDEEGRLAKEMLYVELNEKLGETTTVAQLKQLISTKIDDAEPERLRLSRHGQELVDAHTLREADVPHDADLYLRVIRRGADRRPTPAGSELRPEPPSQPSAKAPSAELTALRLKTLTGRSALLTGLHSGLDIQQLRALVALHPLMRDEPAPEESKKGDGKKGGKDKPAEEPPADDAPPGTGLLLFGVGSDLDLGDEAYADRGAGNEEGGEGGGGADGGGGGAGEGEAVSWGDKLTGEVPNGGEGVLGLDLAQANGTDSARGLPPTTPRGTHLLVHLRDGHELREYGLVHESIIYVCKDTKG